jgi:hypothetical protein
MDTSESAARKLSLDTILEAAASRGGDGSGKNELIGYLRFLARYHPRVFMKLLAKTLPRQKR